MDDFYKSIYAHQVGSAFDTAVCGRFAYGSIDTGTEYPYAVFFGLPSTNEDTFVDEIDFMSVQINIYSDKNSPTEALQVLKKCRAIFDGAVITPAGGREYTLTRSMETPPWKNGDIWVASIEFGTLLQKD